MNQSRKDLFVSIIMPAYNVEKYIAASIESVMNQTFKNWELIIIDDGSTDGTADIVKSYIEKDDRIKYLYQENARQARARNNGISHAKGSLLAFLDSDDMWLPQKLEISLASFDLELYDLIFTNSYSTDEGIIDVLSTSFEVMNVKAREYYGKEALQSFIEFNRVPILTVLVKKSALEEVGLFDEYCVPAEDYDLWVRLLKNGSKFKSIDLPLSIYRVQESSSTASDRFATASVVKSIAKNFTSQELKELQVEQYLRKWLLRWIDFSLNKTSISIFKRYVFQFNFSNKLIISLFLFHKFMWFNRFKSQIKKALQ